MKKKVCILSHGLSNNGIDIFVRNVVTRLDRSKWDVTVILENNHEGSRPTALEGLKCDRENLIVTAFKRSEDGCGTVLRAYETEGRETTATFTGAALPAPLTALWKPWSVQTYYLPDGDTAWKEVLLTEFDME